MEDVLEKTEKWLCLIKYQTGNRDLSVWSLELAWRQIFCPGKLSWTQECHRYVNWHTVFRKDWEGFITQVFCTVSHLIPDQSYDYPLLYRWGHWGSKGIKGWHKDPQLRSGPASDCQVRISSSNSKVLSQPFKKQVCPNKGAIRWD